MPNRSGLIFSLFFLAAVLAAPLSASAGGAAAPFVYPASLLDAPATLAEPPANFLRAGKPVVALDVTTLQAAADFFGATSLREGSGDFSRDYMCLDGTENGRPVRAWLIASGGERVSEAQLVSISPEEQKIGRCSRLRVEMLPLRLGKIGIGMTKKLVLEFAGNPSDEDSDGWSYWFSQRWLRNERNLQELELNWLAVKFKGGVVERAFISLVKNP